MTWLGDLWDSASKKVSNVYHTIKDTASNWLSGKYLAPGGYRYCGPGNPLENGEPINESDSLCRQHDQDYANFATMRDQGKVTKDELKRLIRESDDRLVSGLQQTKDRDLGSRLSEYGIRTKKALEDWGILNPEKFVV
jgi:hypothetical protein